MRIYPASIPPPPPPQPAPQNLGTWLLKAFGIPTDGVVGIKLEIKNGDLPLLTVTSVVTSQGSEALTALLQTSEFELKQRSAERNSLNLG
jgi:hypothetical protein